jgi:hypothetical protein
LAIKTFLFILLHLYSNVWPENTAVVLTNHTTHLDLCGPILFPKFKLILKEEIIHDVIIVTIVVEFQERISTDAIINGNIINSIKQSLNKYSKTAGDFTSPHRPPFSIL